MKNFFEIFSQSKIKKILSFDGGVRAIAGIVFLKQLEIATRKSVFDLFDMFIRTSASGINASCITMNKMNAEEMDKFWSKDNLSKMVVRIW